MGVRIENTVEASPGRTGTRKAGRAETPVTARIRGRIGQRAHVEAKLEEVVVEEKPKPEEPPTAPTAVVAMPVPSKDHRRSIKRRMQCDEVQLRLF
jgi:hypothetical protein